MGLLTSDSSDKTSVLAKVLTKHCGKLSLLSYLIGLAVCAVLLTEADRTYFSDNALLPGLVQREFTLKDVAQQTLQSLNKVSDHYIENQIPYEWIISQFRQIGLEVYTHNFTLNYPFGSKPRFSGKNVYAILRTARSASTEAIVLSTPYRNKLSPHGTTLPGIALMITIAKYFSSRTYWAKDIIFLISDHELVGMQSWLNAYHHIDKSPVLDHGILESRSGPIQAAINLEIHSEITSRIDIKIEGLNGQLPNLDLFNIAVELCTRESITPTFHGHSQPMETDSFELWKQYAITTGSMMVSQGITLPTGAHGLFQRFAIQAITLEAPELGSKRNTHLTVSLVQIGRLIEGIFRSLNNLLEKFNRSYYFYLLPSTRRYISIGYYMIPFGFIALPLVLNALNLYLKSQESTTDSTDRIDSTDSTDSLWNALPINLICHALGLLLLLVPIFIEKFPNLTYNYPTHELIYYTLLIISLLFIMNPLLRANSSNSHLRKCVALLNIALLMCCLSLVNISLAFSLTLIYVPIACLSGISSLKLFKLLNSFILVLIHPLAISFICLISMSKWYSNEISILTHLERAIEAHKKVILFYIEDWYIYGNWTYLFGCSFLFPVWLQLWYI